MTHHQTKIRFENINSAGRSMVEMLGTLAVMGVLAVGGIMGYRFAMDKYRANQTMNDVNLRAHTIEMQLSRGIDISLSEFSLTSAAGYAFLEPTLETDATTGEKVVNLSVQGLEKSICQIVKDGMPNYEIIINKDNEANANCADLETGNMLTFMLKSEQSTGEATNNAADDPLSDLSSDFEWPQTILCKPGISTSLVIDEGKYAGEYACGGEDSNSDTEACPDGQYLYKDECVEQCPHGTMKIDGNWYSGPKCVSGCRTNQDCGAGEYCFVRTVETDLGSCPDFSLWEDCPDYDGNPTYGDCRNAKKDALKAGKGVFSKVEMTFQSAHRFCSVFNKNVLSYDSPNSNVSLPSGINAWIWIKRGYDAYSTDIISVYLLDMDGVMNTLTEQNVTDLAGGQALHAVCE